MDNLDLAFGVIALLGVLGGAIAWFAYSLPLEKRPSGKGQPSPE